MWRSPLECFPSGVFGRSVRKSREESGNVVFSVSKDGWNGLTTPADRYDQDAEG